jgi:tight adherence protein C
MSAESAVAPLWFVAATAGVALLQRMLRMERPPAGFAHALTTWPMPLRPLLGPARLVTTLIADRLPPGYSARIRRRLEMADLHPGVNPAQWTGLCLSAAFVAAIASAAGCLLAGFNVAPWAVLAAAIAWVACERWIHRRIADRERRIARELPACLDLLTVCVEAGATLTAASRFIVEQAPEGPLRNYFDRVLREVRSGRGRAQAFTSVADSYGVECLSTLASALSHAEAAGMSIGQVLRTQAEQRSSERFVRAERQAMQAPVKMLGPLIFCIFPCTFIVLAVPIAYRLVEAFRT